MKIPGKFNNGGERDEGNAPCFGMVPKAIGRTILEMFRRWRELPGLYREV